ncbi:hypothetical protein AURDEDRAFT_161791 [Auricularia subglabra TFB-10046 SS5]|nr:hypothetical protein AURDEDRAFT_161791 [Auricularia subglabra TFB-10046 SS5]
MAKHRQTRPLDSPPAPPPTPDTPTPPSFVLPIPHSSSHIAAAHMLALDLCSASFCRCFCLFGIDLSVPPPTPYPSALARLHLLAPLLNLRLLPSGSPSA